MFTNLKNKESCRIKALIKGKCGHKRSRFFVTKLNIWGSGSIGLVWLDVWANLQTWILNFVKIDEKWTDL